MLSFRLLNGDSRPEAPSRAVDSYCHCGLSKYLPVESVHEAMARAGIDRAVLVQHLGEYHHEYIASVVEADPTTFCGVGLIDPSARSWKRQLGTLRELGFRGLRVPGQMLINDTATAYEAASIGFVLLIDPRDGVATVLPAVREIARISRAPILIAHLGYPKVAAGRVERGWELLHLADLPSVSVLLSGHAMWAAYPYTELKALTSAVVSEFGADRILWGSNFPVADGNAVARDVDLFASGAFGLGPDESVGALRENALRLWWGRNLVESA